MNESEFKKEKIYRGRDKEKTCKSPSHKFWWKTISELSNKPHALTHSFPLVKNSWPIFPQKKKKKNNLAITQNVNLVLATKAFFVVSNIISNTVNKRIDKTSTID